MGEVPRARNTAQNTLTTWHADRLYGTILIDSLQLDFFMVSEFQLICVCLKFKIVEMPQFYKYSLLVGEKIGEHIHKQVASG